MCMTCGDPHLETQCQQSRRQGYKVELLTCRATKPYRTKALPTMNSILITAKPKSTPGKWRLIVDMSSPEEVSVNDGVKESLCSLSYMTIMDVTKDVAVFGRGMSMAKVDIMNTYRVVPVHLD